MRSRFIAVTVLLTAALLVARSGRAEAKTKIAILGIQADDSGATADKSANLARWITEELRAKAQQTRNKFELGQNTNKDLKELTLFGDCLDEAPECMATIGKDLGVERLLFGHLTKTKSGWLLTLKYLNVATKQVEKEEIPIASGDATEAGARKVASSAFGRITGVGNAGSIEIQANVDDATVYIDGTPKTAVSGRAASITDLAEGTYNVVIEAEGMKRWERTVKVKAGEPTLLVAELEAESVGGGGGGGGGGGDKGGGRPGGGSRALFWTSVVVTAGGVTAFSITGSKVLGYENDKDAAIKASRVGLPKGDPAAINAGDGEDACAEARRESYQPLVAICDDADSMANLTNVFIGVTAVGAVAAAYFYYKGYIAPGKAEKKGSAKAKGKRGKKAAKAPSEVIIAPQIYKDGAGVGAVITF